MIEGRKRSRNSEFPITFPAFFNSSPEKETLVTVMVPKITIKKEGILKKEKLVPQFWNA